MELNVKHYATVVITFAIMALLTVAVLVPVVNDAQHGVDTAYTNEGSGLDLVNLNVVTSGSVDYSDATAPQITLNGKSYTTTGATPTSAIIMSEFCKIGMNYSSGSWASVIDYWNGTSAGHDTTAYKKVEFTLADKILEVVATPASGTAVTYAMPACDWAFKYDNVTPEYVYITQITGQKTVYIDGVDDLYAGVYTMTNGYAYALHGDSVKVNGQTQTSAATINETEVEANISSVAISYQGTTDVSFTFNNGSTPTTCKVFQVVAPSVVYADTGEYSSVMALVGIVPLLVLCGLVIGVIGTLVSRRD